MYVGRTVAYFDSISWHCLADRACGNTKWVPHGTVLAETGRTREQTGLLLAAEHRSLAGPGIFVISLDFTSPSLQVGKNDRTRNSSTVKILGSPYDLQWIVVSAMCALFVSGKGRYASCTNFNMPGTKKGFQNVSSIHSFVKNSSCNMLLTPIPTSHQSARKISSPFDTFTSRSKSTPYILGQSDAMLSLQLLS